MGIELIKIFSLSSQAHSKVSTQQAAGYRFSNHELYWKDITSDVPEKRIVLTHMWNWTCWRALCPHSIKTKCKQLELYPLRVKHSVLQYCITQIICFSLIRTGSQYVNKWNWNPDAVSNPVYQGLCFWVPLSNHISFQSTKSWLFSSQGNCRHLPFNALNGLR